MKSLAFDVQMPVLVTAGCVVGRGAGDAAVLAREVLTNGLAFSMVWEAVCDPRGTPRDAWEDLELVVSTADGVWRYPRQTRDRSPRLTANGGAMSGPGVLTMPLTVEPVPSASGMRLEALWPSQGLAAAAVDISAVMFRDACARVGLITELPLGLSQ